MSAPRLSREQFEALLTYIDARIDEKTDDNSSDDNGLSSAISTMTAMAELSAVLMEEEE